ncbi:DUF6496 domain-containing protein [Chthonobacter albigriseus]|uniref:DUF6496 domain-containing protein n=1 Tax=Chthonobacter albigriseus TaxID=1683161 RepID=UPI0015EEE5CD|nr:DUF6496 domain-containing protein [Chthonobacter albigriseus]
MAKQTEPQKETVERVMRAFKHGDLERNDGRKVKNPKQAIAIALSEAGASSEQSPRENRERLTSTKAKERKGRAARAEKRNKRASRPKGDGAGEATKADLYAEARKRDIPGRSKMSRDELARALRR